MSPRSPSRLKKLRWKLAALYQRHWRGDEFLAQHRLWLAAEGDQKLRLDYALGPESVVFDVGGYVGDFAAEIRARFGSRVWLFEPVSRLHRECQARFTDDTSVVSLPFGLGDQEQELEMHDDADASGAFNPASVGRPVEKVRLRAFADFLAETGLPKVDLLKINIEGGEFPLLDHLIDSGRIKDVGYIQVQFHDFYPEAKPRRERIRRLLSKTHVEQWNFPFIWESWKRRGKGDGFSIHTIGDSHGGGVSGLSGAFDLVGGVTPHHLGPRLMHSIGRDGLDLRKQGIKDGDTVICCFGEIDCRCHVHKFGPDYRKTITATVERYVQALLANLERLPRLRLCVYNIPPPIRKAGKVENPEYPYLGSDEERRAYVNFMNELLAQQCARHGLIFVDLAREYADEHGFLRDSQSDGNVHIADPDPLRRFLELHLR
jgi:FkbM family methyltransferase